MSYPTFPIKQGDLEPAYAAQLVTGDRPQAPIPLTNCTVTFQMTLVGASQPTVSAPAIIDDISNGLVRYVFASGDTSTAGTYGVEWIITYPGNRTRRVPSEGVATIIISADPGY